MNVFKELIASVWNFKAYKQFMQNKGGKVFGFSMLLFAIYALISTVIPALALVNPFHNTFADMIEEGIPEFVLEDGILQMEERFAYEDAQNYIFIDTQEKLDLDEFADIVRSKNTVVLMDAEKAAIKNRGERNLFYFSEIQQAFDIDRMTKDDLYSLLPFVSVIYIICIIFLIIGQTAAFYLRILLVSLIVLLMASLMNLKFSYGSLFKLSVYTRTVPVAVRALLGVLNWSIPFFFLIDLAVSAVYAYFALKEIKKDSLQTQPYYYVTDDGGQQPYGY